MKTRIIEKQYADRYEFIPQVKFFWFWWGYMSEAVANGNRIVVVRKTKAEAAAYIKNKHPDIIFHYPV